MIKESCNLIEQEYILVSHKKVYAINDKLEFNESFILNYFQWGHTTPRSTNFIPGRSRHVWAHQTSSSSLTCYLSFGYCLYAKNLRQCLFSSRDIDDQRIL